MSEEIDRKDGAQARETDLDDMHPAARAVLGALVLPVTAIIAAGVLLVIGISMVLVALVLVAALVAGAASVPLAVLAGRRRRNPTARGGQEVLDAQATVREVQPAGEEKVDGEPDAPRR